MPEPTFPFELTLTQALDLAGIAQANAHDLAGYLPSCARRLELAHETLTAQALDHARTLAPAPLAAFHASNDQILAELRDADREPR